MNAIKTREEADLVAKAIANLKGPNPKAILRKLDSPTRALIDGEAVPLDPVADRWRRRAQRVNTFCWRAEDGTRFCAHVGPEPQSEAHRKQMLKEGLLGYGGQGWFITMEEGERIPCFNFNSDEQIPTEYAGFFTVNCQGWQRMTMAEERAHWATRLNPFSDVEEFGWRTKEVA